MLVENDAPIKSDNNFLQVKSQINHTYSSTNPNAVDKTPDKDTVSLSKISTAKKVGIGAMVVGLALGASFLLRGKKPLKQVAQKKEGYIENSTSSITDFAKIEPNVAAAIEAKKTEEEMLTKLQQSSNGFEIKMYKTGNSGNNGKYKLDVSKNGYKASSTCYIEKDYISPAYMLTEYANSVGEYTAMNLESLNGTGGGAGTEAVKKVIQLSKVLGCDGRVTLKACNYSSPERGTPVPFYNKLGFRAVDSDIQAEIELGMEHLKKTGEYTGPKDCYMYLPIENIESLLH